MAQSIKSLRKSVVNLQRKVNKERKRQEQVIGLQQALFTLAEEYDVLKQNGSDGQLHVRAQETLYRPKD